MHEDLEVKIAAMTEEAIQRVRADVKSCKLDELPLVVNSVTQLYTTMQLLNNKVERSALEEQAIRQVVELIGKASQDGNVPPPGYHTKLP